MKFYVASPLGMVKQTKQAMRIIRRNGHQITHDWTKSDMFLAGEKQKEANPDEAAHRAIDDVKGVTDADVVIFLTSEEYAARGMYVELGIALAEYAHKGSPRIFFIKPIYSKSIFFYHPYVEHADSVKQVIETVERA